MQTVVQSIARILGMLGALARDVEYLVILGRQESIGETLATEDLVLAHRQDPVIPKYAAP